jgi:transcriptional regulator with PAS, ATPase and Fis domain
MDDAHQTSINSSGQRIHVATVDGPPEGLCLLGPGPTLLAANQAAVEMLGLPAHVAGSDPASGVIPPDLESLVSEAFEGGLPVHRPHTATNGRALLVAAQPARSSWGVVSFVVLALRDRKPLGAGEASSPPRDALVARSRAMTEVRQRALQFAAVDSPVLILGEGGTGKRHVARFIHSLSSRQHAPLLEVSCGALPEAALEIELFGEIGGPSSCGVERPGLIERARGGTVLLGEIGDLPSRLQAKLVRLLDDGELWPVGASEAHRADVRILSTSRDDLAERVADHTFRADLYYRLNALTLSLPPLRQRAEDIPLLVAGALARVAETMGRAPMIAPSAIEAISRGRFPGNVRELGNLVERLALGVRGEVITLSDLPAELTGATLRSAADDRRVSLRKTLREIEAQMIRDALAQYGTQTLAALHLGVTQSTVARKAKQYGLGRRLA